MAGGGGGGGVATHDDGVHDGASHHTSFGGATFDLGPDAGLVAIRSAQQLVSDGTTGLRAWEAAAALSEWLLAQGPRWAGRAWRACSLALFALLACLLTTTNGPSPAGTVLELGAGVGLAGLALARVLPRGRVLLSDFHPAVLANLRNHSLPLNAPFPAGVAVHAGTLDWAAPDLAALAPGAPPEVDVVIGSDLVYDRDIIPALVALLVALGKEAFIASTLRNEATLALFLDALAAAGVAVTAVPLPPPRVFHRPAAATIFLHHLVPPAAA